MKEGVIMNNKINTVFKRICALGLSVCMTATFAPLEYLKAEERPAATIENTALKASVSEKTGGYAIVTVNGDKVNKEDDGKKLLFDMDEDNTSFTTFQVTRDGKTKEYVFGGNYLFDNSSPMTVTKSGDTINAVWTVADITFTQSIRLVNTGSNEHGMAYISYTAENKGEKTDIKCRLLMDTALGDLDYGYYNVGDADDLVTKERELPEDGYNKTFYAVDNPIDPSIVAYTVNASVENRECKPYKTVFAHWASLAGCLFDYSVDKRVSFVTTINGEHMTADSAVAEYFDLGSLEKDKSATVALNYGVYSNETVTANGSAAINIVAPDYIEKNEAKTGYKDGGKFKVRSQIENISDHVFERVRVVVYASGGIRSLDKEGNVMETSYEKPYYLDMFNFSPGQRQTLDFNFDVPVRAAGALATVKFRVFNMSSDATQGSDLLVSDNLMCEGKSYILIPGIESELPEVKFTGSAPEMLYNKGRRNLTITGDNFSMLMDKSAYNLRIESHTKKPFAATPGDEAFYGDSLTIPSENISVNEDNNTITILMDDVFPGQLTPGAYDLIVDYVDSTKTDESGPALGFVSTDEMKYKSNTYGVLAVMKNAGGGNFEYNIKTWDTEDDFELDSTISVKNAPLVFRGYFTEDEKKDSSDKKRVFKAISAGPGENVVVLNDTLDISEGSVTITEEDNSVTVDFDAKITCGGKHVYSGVCALTKLSAGKSYSLIKYNEDGESTNPGNAINLIWPSVGNTFQNIMGFLMKFKYGQLGYMEHDEGDPTMVVAYGASLDLGFVIPEYAQPGEEEDDLATAYENALKNGTPLTPYEIRDIQQKVGERQVYDKNADGTDMTDDSNEIKTPKASVHIDDILFGEGKCLGVNMEIGLAVPGYVEGMPELEGVMEIKTIGNWGVSVEGQCDFEVFAVEAALSIVSTDSGFPVPDSFRFFVGEMKPGIALDPFAILWLQGAGGGLSNIYDTIFLEDALPPLRLLLEVQMSIIQVVSAKGSIELGLTGFELKMRDLKLANELSVMDSASIAFDWYPNFYLLGNVRMNVLDVVKGGGYIILECVDPEIRQYFYEFFINASINIPDEIPVVGGMQVGAVGLGANSQKLYGMIKALSIPVGVVYYWGDKFRWKDGQEVMPTYPELADIKDTPVYYSEEEGRTLYAHVGTNFVDNTVTSGTGSTSGKNVVKSNPLPTGGMVHDLELAGNGRNRILLISFEAKDRDEALAALALDDETPGLRINDEEGTRYELNLFDTEKMADSFSNLKANANLSFDKGTGIANLAVTFTENMDEKQNWHVTTQMDSSVILYDLDEMPELTMGQCKIKTDEAGDNILSVKGTRLSAFDKICVSASRKDGGLTGEMENAQLLFAMEKSDPKYADIFKNNGGEIKAELPDTLESGKYEIYMTAMDSDEMYSSKAHFTYDHVNANQPAAPSSFEVKGAGDYKVKISVAEGEDSFDGYSVSAYDSKGEVVNGLGNLMYYKNGEKLVMGMDGAVNQPDASHADEGIIFGGHYEFSPSKEGGDSEESSDGDDETGETQIMGFSAGTYTLGVKKWKKLDSGNILYSPEVKKSVTITDPVKAKLSVASAHKAVDILSGPASAPYKVPYYNVADPALTVKADMPVSGSWKLDGGRDDSVSLNGVSAGGLEGSFGEGSDISIATGELKDGVHSLEITAVNGSGDITKEKFMFGIDTTAPKILLNDPVSGDCFDHKTGKIHFSGVTDPNLTVKIKDTVSGESFELKADIDGRFEGEHVFKTDEAMLKLVLCSTDEVGNEGENSVELCADALGQIAGVKLKAVNAEGKIAELEDGVSSLETGEYSLELYGVLKDGEEIGLNSSSLVDWQAVGTQGDINLSVDGSDVKLSVHDGDIGMLSASYKIHDLGAYNVVTMIGKKSGVEWTDTEGGQAGALKTTKLNVSAKGPAGEDLSLDLVYTGAVTYNGMKHVVEGMKTSKKIKDDLHFELKGTLMQYADVQFTLKNNQNVPVKVKNGMATPLPDKKKPAVTIRIKPKKGIDAEWKKAVKAAAKELKKQPVGFDILPYDLSDTKPVIKKNLTGSKVTKATITLEGLQLKLGKKDFTYSMEDGNVVLKGIGNYTGTCNCTP